MDMTIGRSRVGSKLVFGRYGVRNDNSAPIVWLKATPNGDFITENVVDYLCFDARERSADTYNERAFGRANYKLSNVLAFLNSDQQIWWNPSHPSDSPPERNCVYSAREAYNEHTGFLYDFEDYELECVLRTEHVVNGEVVSSIMRLPSLEEILSEDRFPLFRRKGVRAHGTEDFMNIRGPMTGFESGSYMDFWLSACSGERAQIVGRSGYKDGKSPYHPSGLRPVCSIKPEIILDEDENGVYHIRPFATHSNVFNDEELFALLGMAQP